MKISKNLLICALLVLVMLCIVGTASAAEPLSENMTATDVGEEAISDIAEEPVAASDSGDELSAEGDTITVDAGGSGDYTTISAAVSAANGGETIFIKNGEYTEADTIKISKSLNFVGESNDGVSLKLAQSGSKSLIESNTNGISISFKNLIFKNSESTTGSGIIRFYGSSVQIDLNFTDCTFSNLTNKYGIQIATLGTINFEGCKFTNLVSKSSNGATGIYTSVASTINIKDTIFDNLQYVSTGGQNGAVIFMSNAGSTLNMENVTIQNFSGAANSIVRSTGTVDIKKSKFVNNNVQLSSAGYVGESLFYIGASGKMTMEQSIIANNTVAKNVIYMGSSASTTMNYNNICNNTFDSSYEGGFKTNDGALDADYNYWGSNDKPATPVVNNWVIEENGVFKLNDGSELAKEIPSLDEETEPEVEYDIYVDCYAADGGDGSKTSPFNSISAAVSAASDGNSIFIKNGQYTESSKITLTKSLSFVGESKDGVIITSASNQGIFDMTKNGVVLSFKQLTFSNVNSGTGSNLVMKIGGDSDVDIINCSFVDCTGKYGVIQLYTTATATISDCTITNFKSSASAGTGGIYLTGNGIYNIKNTLIDNSQFTASAGYMYGIIYSSGKTSVTTLDNVTISNCEGAASSVIYTKAKMTVTNSKIINNIVKTSATGYQGESIFYTSYNSNNNPNAELLIEQTVIANNEGPNNFIYANNNNAKTTINYCNLQNNTFGTFATANGNFDFEYNYWGSNDAPTNPSVTRYAIMDGEGHFTDDQGNALAKEIPIPGEEGGDEPAVLDIIYVSDSGSNDNDGSMSSPVKTIGKAIEIAQKGKIVILPGTYTLSETLSIAKDLDIEGRGNVFINGNVQLFSNAAKLNLTNIKFNSAADVNGAVVSSTGDLNIDSCVFDVNTESGNAIYIDGGNANIVNSVLLNPAGYALTASSSPSTITANNNWWGKNDGANTQESVSSWIVMDASVDLAKINVGDEVTITVSFNKTNGGSDYSGALPEFNITIAANNLNEQIAVQGNKATKKYTVNEDDEATITSGSESVKVPLKLYEAPEVIYVDAENGLDTNDGDELHPVQSISKAIEIAQKGKIVILAGTYTIDNTLTVSKDLDITGEGTVTIDGNSKRILTNNANLNITNVQFTNGFDSSAVIVNNANLTLNNTLFYSNVNLNGYGASVIRNNKNLIILDSKFYENKERYGNVYNNAGELYINNTEFFNNDLAGVTTVPTGLALYSDSGNAKIENSRFYDNKGNFSVIYFKSKDSLSASVINNLTINNCIFDGNELVRYGVIYSEKANTIIKDSTFTDNVVKKLGMANGEGSAIYVNGEKVSVETSVFINNNADDSGKDIYVYAGELDISDSVLINGNGYSIEKATSAVVIANDNWWGANNPNTSVDVERWIVMTVISNDSDIETGDEIIITASFDKTNDGEAYTGDLPEVFNVTFASTSGNLNEVIAVKDKKAEVTYTVDKADKELTVTSNDALEKLTIHRILDIIYVDAENGLNTNDGDRDTPVATLEKAIELAQKGQIVVLPGTYKTGDLGTISQDLNITGEGKVIIDADNNNRILYVGNTSKVVLKNLILINGLASASSDESGALLGNNGDLTLINCTLANSTSAKNGGAIFNALNLTIINSTFENNVAEKNGGAIFTQKSGVGVPTLTVSNSTFRNNTAKGQSNYGGGAIYVQQAADGVLIENSLFENNKCIDYGGGAIEIAQTNVASISNCTFINNRANGQDDKTRSDYGGGAVSFKGYYDSARETLTVTNSLFIDNSVNEWGGGAIYAMYSTVDIHNSVLINNGDNNGVSVYGRDADLAPAKITANDNWWGSNDNPKSSINRGTLTRWAVMTISNDSAINAGETVTLTVSINQYTTGTANGTLASPINVARPVVIYTNLGNIEGTLANGEFTTQYLVPAGLKIISASVDSESQVLYVITTQTKVDIADITGLMGDRLEYTISVSTNDGSIVNTGNVELYFGETLVKTIPVLNGEAKDTLIINKQTGVYTITAKYIDPTEEFANNESTATLNVTGIDNVVTPETIDKFFDNGVLKSDLPFDEIIFQGTFDDIGVLTINTPIKLTGDGVVFNNASFKLNGDNIELSNVAIVLDKNFDETDGAAVYIGGDNVVLSNNNITYNAPDNVQSYAIEVDMSDDVKIINNNINYSAKSDGTVKTMGISAVSSDNLVIENNVLNANIPSVDLDYSAYPIVRYYSQGVHVENSDNVSFNKNKVTVNYTNATGYDDTIYAVHFDHSDDSRITNNDIELNGHKYAYGLVTNDCDNITISGNDIKSSSDAKYASGLQVGGKSTAVVDNNNISAKANDVTYPVYLDDWGNDGEVNLTNNNIKGESDTVYGVYVEENKTLISGNTIDVEGNHVYGVVTHQTDVVIESNNITANGKDVGDIVSPQSGVNENTTGIIVSEGSAVITNNNVITNGQSAVTAINTNATINNNGLTANGTTADKSIKNINSNVNASGNTAAKNGTTPKTPVIKITGKNKAKVDYGFTYKVRVTQDGKSVGAGKVVTLKIAGKTLKAKTDKNGYATFKLAVKPKTYTVTVTYNKVSQKYKVTVKNVIKAKNVKVKKSAKKLKVKVTLKTSAKKPIKGKKVVLKIKGKKLKAKTNKKGVAKFKIKKNILKKLKAGKKYKYQVIYGKDKVKKTLKVKK